MNEKLKNKEQQVELYSQKLAHFRSWMQNLQTRFLNHVPQLMKNARRLYIGGLQDVEEEELKSFLQDLMLQTGVLTKPGVAVLSCKISQERTFAFVEFRSVEETSNMLALDGVKYGQNYLKIRRPSNYDSAASLILGPTAADPTIDTSGLDICRTVVEDTASKLFIGGLPCDWNEDQVKHLLVQFGSLKSFNLVMDKATGKSRGYAFCEFQDDGLTDQVIQSLNGKRQGNKNLTVKRALEGPVKTSARASMAPSSLGPSSLAQLTGGQVAGNPDSPTLSLDQLSDIMSKLQANGQAMDRSKSSQLDTLSHQYGFDLYMKQQNEQLKQALGQQKQKQIEEIFRQGFLEGQSNGAGSLNPRDQLAQLGLNQAALSGAPGELESGVVDAQNTVQQQQLNQYLNTIVQNRDNNSHSGSPNDPKSSSNKSSLNVFQPGGGQGSGTNSSNSVNQVGNGVGNVGNAFSPFNYPQQSPLSSHHRGSQVGLSGLQQAYSIPNQYGGGGNVGQLEKSQIMSQLMGAYNGFSNPSGGSNFNQTFNNNHSSNLDVNGCMDQFPMAAMGQTSQLANQCW